jgi:hypothetical protein
MTRTRDTVTEERRSPRRKTRRNGNKARGSQCESTKSIRVSQLETKEIDPAEGPRRILKTSRTTNRTETLPLARSQKTRTLSHRWHDHSVPIGDLDGGFLLFFSSEDPFTEISWRNRRAVHVDRTSRNWRSPKLVLVVIIARSIPLLWRRCYTARLVLLRPPFWPHKRPSRSLLLSANDQSRIMC